MVPQSEQQWMVQQYLNSVGMDAVTEHENVLLEYLTSKLSEVENIRLIGTAAHKASVQSFMVGDIHPHDVGTILDHRGVAIRTGHHCAMPVMAYFEVPGTARASLALYNNTDDIDHLISALHTTVEMFS